MFKKICFIVMMFIIVCTFAKVSSAQEMEEYDISFGTIVSVSESEIIINSDDMEGGEVTQESFLTAPEMVFENFETLDELKVGIFVEIFYQIKGETKVIDSITITTKEVVEEEMNQAELEVDEE